MTGDDLNSALLVAMKAHRGQTDKSGEPYILHPLRLMLAVPAECRIAAILHDTVEDSETVDLGDILSFFGEDVRASVDALTRRDGEDYFDYVRRAAADPVARVVKIADLLDNLRPAGDDGTPESDRRRAKYSAALELLAHHPV